MIMSVLSFSWLGLKVCLPAPHEYGQVHFAPTVILQNQWKGGHPVQQTHRLVGITSLEAYHPHKQHGVGMTGDHMQNSLIDQFGQGQIAFLMSALTAMLGAL